LPIVLARRISVFKAKRWETPFNKTQGDGWVVMANEHLRIPKGEAEWPQFHRDGRAALGEGEITERWLAENRHGGIDEFSRLAGQQGARSSIEENEFGRWRAREELTIAAASTLAATEAATFQKIAAEDAKKRLVPTIDNVQLSGVATDLRRLPRPMNEDELAARRGGPDRGPWEVAFDALGQFGLRPDDARFSSAIEDARTRMWRSTGDLTYGFAAFCRATEIAVATASSETLPSATWEQSQYKRRADDLLTELRSWDRLMRDEAEPAASDLAKQADACAKKLAALAQECTPTGQFSNTAAFANLNGLATVLAIGERMAAQIDSRAGQPTVQTIYDRLREIPNREPADPSSDRGRRYNEGYMNLAGIWKNDLASHKLQFSKNVGVDRAFLDSWFGNNLQKPIADHLAIWDKLMKDPGNMLSAGGLASLKREVAQLAVSLGSLRQIVGGSVAAPGTADIFKEACKDVVTSIDTLTAQMQRRLALALKVGS
jgi:hypothetical protein